MTIQYKPEALIKQISQNNYSYKSSYTKKLTEADSNVEKLQDKAETFKKKVKALKKYTSGGISRDLLATQVEDLVKSYNNMTGSADKVTDKDVQKQLSKLEKLFSDNEKELKKIGIEKVNGKYTFDSDTFEDASSKNIDAVLTGHDSFIDKAEKIMRKVEETTDDAKYITSEYKLNKTYNYEETDMVLASYMTLAGQCTSIINSYNDPVQTDNVSNDAADLIKTSLQYFAQSVYRTDTTNENENIDKLNQLCLANKEKLAKVGVFFDNGQKNMFFDPATDMTTNDFKTAYDELFGSNAQFGTAVSKYCKDTFNDIIQPDKLGVSIIDEFV